MIETLVNDTNIISCFFVSLIIIKVKVVSILIQIVKFHESVF